MSGWRLRARTHVGELALDVELQGDARPLALIGPNGSGKTSVLRILAGLLATRDGEARIGERTLFDTARGIDLPPARRGLGYVPQGYALFPHLRVLDNVAFGLAHGPGKQPARERRKAAQALLEQLGCAGLAQRYPRNLSGGEQQRVALARALLIRPPMLLLDEPLSALDAGARRSVRTLLAKHLRELARPCLIVTHDARDVAALDAQVCVLEAGRVVQRGSLAQLRAAPASEFVAEFSEPVPIG